MLRWGFNHKRPLAVEIPDERKVPIPAERSYPGISARTIPIPGMIANECAAAWTFSAIDPYTGQFTEDPLAGFLPPNGDNHEGEGLVKFKISPRSNLPTGTVIDNMATIVFDWNPPIDTPPVFNTIDAEAPSSQVQALFSESPHRFEVSWSGQDDDEGSGIAGYDIYVAENGGEYTLWLKDTFVTSLTFSGQEGSTYAFYSVASDYVGHREQVPTGPDTTTTALPNNPRPPASL